MKYCTAILLTLFGALVCARGTPDYTADGDAWWSHVAVLADDKMEGRNTGSAGHRNAAAYVADEFERLGLKPAGPEGFFQPMKFNARQIVEDQSSLELVRDGRSDRLSLADDANFLLPPDMAERVEARAVFVGHGLVIPELKIDDLAGLDLKGRIAVLISGGPTNIPGTLKSHYSHTKQQWGALRKAGAIGMAVIRNPKSTDLPWTRSTLARLQPAMSLAEPSLNDAAGTKISLRINPETADKFFAGSGHAIGELLKLADDNQPLPKFPLAVSVRAKAVIKRSELTSVNVVGLLEGTDRELRKEHIVLSAHLDHLGIGQPINGDNLYNGAMDNAAGVASILEVARMWKASGATPKRSILFLAVTGEEKGLQGSKYFANHPTVPKESLVADLNTDMFLPLHPLKLVRVYGLEESTLGDDIRAVCAAEGIQVQADPEPNRNIFIRSDQYSFIRRGIPSLFYGFGSEPGSPEEKLQKDWHQNRYHGPSDDLSQPVDKAAAARFNYLLFGLSQRVANASERPHWKSDSFFRRFAP